MTNQMKLSLPMILSCVYHPPTPVSQVIPIGRIGARTPDR